MLRILRIAPPKRTFNFASIRNYSPKSSYRSEDTTVETDEVLTDNNPWSPTLYNDIVYVKRGFRNVPLAENLRLSYEPLYESPGSKYVAITKRLTLSFGVLGIYASKLLYELVMFDDIFALATILGTWAPVLAVQLKTRDYVTRIFRLYDKKKPQTLENLVDDEQLIVEKLNVTGGKTYNQLLRISDNSSFKIVPGGEELLSPYRSWQDTSDGHKRYFYVVDNIGGLKMDRLWGIAEHNSGVDNGRFLPEALKHHSNGG